MLVQLFAKDLPMIWAIRQKAMYPNHPIEIVKLPKDETIFHFAWKVNDQIVSVIAVENEGQIFQFRKFATLPEFQNLGYGSQLLTEVLGWIQDQGALKVWCNARLSTSKYYQKFGLNIVGETYIKNDIAFVTMEKIIEHVNHSCN